MTDIETERRRATQKDIERQKDSGYDMERDRKIE